MGEAARRLLLVLVLGLAAGFPAAASADSFYCTINGVPPGGGGSAWFCAGTSTSGAVGWSPMVSGPDAAGATPVSAASAGSNGGDFAASASASASAGPGLLRMEAEASSFGNGLGRATGAAQASMWEEGTFVGAGGAAPGTPITARLTLDVAGAFTAVPASADGEFDVYRGFTLLAHRDLFLSTVDGDFFEEIALPGLVVGDEISVSLRLRAQASGEDVGITGSAADLSNSGHLYLDVTSGNATFDSASGHDYSTAPEPGAVLLVLVGAAVLCGARASRRF
jgi:hypothetical protein